MKGVLEVASIFLMLSMAVVSDLKTGKISNRYNAVWIIYGFMFSLMTEGVGGITKSLVGVAIPVVVLIALFAWRVIGAGDIKLFSAMGTFLGINVFYIIAYSFLLCSVYGLIMVIAKISKGIDKGSKGHGLLRLRMNGRGYTKVAFSPFIVGGFVLYLLKGGFLFGI